MAGISNQKRPSQTRNWMVFGELETLCYFPSCFLMCERVGLHHPIEKIIIYRMNGSGFFDH